MGGFDSRAEELRRRISAPAPAPQGPAERLARAGLARLLADRQQLDRALLGLVDELRAEQRAAQAQTDQRLGELRQWLAATSDRGDEMAGRLEGMIAEIERDRRQTHDELARMNRRVAQDVPLHGPGRLPLERFDAGLGGEVYGFRAAGGHDGDGVYAGFEDWFRGSEKEVAERQRAYLPLVRDRAPVLDVGCGRGEFLEILREAGIEAEGIDIDAEMVRRCHEKGFTGVQQADAVAHLRDRAPGSLGTVFAAQVIEHLPYEELVEFLRCARAALRPDGVLIAETVNPHVPQALKHFWIDPTHQHPLFPETVLALCRLTGFASAYLWYPQGSGDPDRDRGEQPDYAIVAQQQDPERP